MTEFIEYMGTIQYNREEEEEKDTCPGRTLHEFDTGVGWVTQIPAIEKEEEDVKANTTARVRGDATKCQ